MLLLKLQCFGHLLWRANWLEKTLILGKIEDKRRRGQQRMRELESITASVDMNLSKLQEIVKNKEAWHAAILQRVRYDLVIEQQTTKTTVKLFQTVYWKVYPSSINLLLHIVKSYLDACWLYLGSLPCSIGWHASLSNNTTVSTMVALQQAIMWGRWFLPLYFSVTVLAILGPMFFHINFRRNSISTKIVYLYKNRLFLQKSFLRF